MMTPKILKLDWLPGDVLLQIVALGSCETALALSQVNKRLQQVCNDPGLYKSIIENHRGYEIATWYSTMVSMESPISTWARYAFADAKAAQWSLDPPFIPGLYTKPQIESNTIARFRDFASWGPQLMASYHPVVNSINTRTLFEFLNSSQWPLSSERHDVRYALTFCLVIKILKEKLSFLNLRGYRWHYQRGASWSHPASHGLQWHSYRNTMEVELRHSKHADSFGLRLSDDRDNDKVTTETRHRLLIALALFSYDFQKMCPSRRTLEPVPPKQLAPRHIPFISMMGLPPPLSLNATGDFATCHLSKMTSEDFFNDGLWIYGKSMGRDEIILSGVPVRGVAIIARQTEAHPSKLILYGSGSDLKGDFSLEGHIDQETGRVHLVKRYIISTPNTYLSGLMTPFGMVGVQTSSKSVEFGWFWLWKAAWTRERESLPHA